MGGPVQAKEGVLGGIVGASDVNFKIAEPYFNIFCKDYFLSLIHISEPTRRTPISYAVFCLKKK